LARALNVPLLVELNAPLALEQSAYRGAGLGQLAAQAERWVPSQADAVFAVSAPLRDHVIALGVEPDRVYVLPNAVDPALFQSGAPDPAVRARWGLGEGRDEATGGTRRAERGGSGDGGSVDAHPGAPVLGFVGGLRPWHGVEALPRLLERLIPRYRDLRLVIAGDGPLRGELERDLRERGLAQSAVFTGSLPQEEVATLIRLFDVALAPYPQPRHAFYFSPLKLFEYMACGVPVVAAGLGQIAEVVCDGETGLLYPPGELDALTAACDRLLADPALRRRLGQAAAEAIHGRYTWDVNAARVAERARSLIAARETVR
jgi:glycosyltransferase involved in cell wall biosynthesis